MQTVPAVQFAARIWYCDYGRIEAQFLGDAFRMGEQNNETDQWIFPPTLADIRDASNALRGVVVETPVLENHDVNERLGGRLLIKAETAQRTGSFKIRGAYNRMRQLDETQKTRGVIAYSSGNHAQAVATAARMVGTRALIVMPSDAPANKMA